MLWHEKLNASSVWANKVRQSQPAKAFQDPSPKGKEAGKAEARSLDPRLNANLELSMSAKQVRQNKTKSACYSFPLTDLTPSDTNLLLFQLCYLSLTKGIVVALPEVALHAGIIVKGHSQHQAALAAFFGRLLIMG